MKRAQGMPGAGCTHGPPAEKKQAAVTTGQPKQPAFPAQWFYGLYVISPGTGLVCPRRTQRASRCELGLSVGRSGPHDFAVHISIARLATLTRPSQPALNVRDDASVPLWSRRDDGESTTLLRKTEVKYFR